MADDFEVFFIKNGQEVANVMFPDFEGMLTSPKSWDKYMNDRYETLYPESMIEIGYKDQRYAYNKSSHTLDLMSSW